MRRRSILSVFATISLGLALFAIIAGNTARAAEIKLLCAVALHPALDVLIPDFEKSSGHKVTVAYGNAGAIADRFQKGEAADLMINAAPLMAAPSALTPSPASSLNLSSLCRDQLTYKAISGAQDEHVHRRS